MRICSKKSCNELGTHKNGSSQYCDKCWRFRFMRYFAKRRNKYVPSIKELDELLFKLGNEMKCPNCGIKMFWLTEQANRSVTISLQHNNNGMIILICQGCNVAHKNSKLGDQYFNIPKNHKYCAQCDMILNQIEFYKNRNRRDGFCALCKKCRYINRKNWRKKCLEFNKCINCGKDRSSKSKCYCDNCFEKYKVRSKKCL